MLEHGEAGSGGGDEGVSPETLAVLGAPNLRRQRRRAQGPHTTLAATAVLVVSLAGAAGCTLVDKPPQPDPTAAALAEGLAKGDVSQVAFDGSTGAAATAFVTSATAQVKAVPRTVTVTSVTPDKTNDKAATATLTYSWQVTPKAAWTYTTQAALTLADDKTWHVAWTPELLAPDFTTTEKMVLKQTAPKRADIVGANKTPLMSERATFDIGIDKSRVTAAVAATSAAALAQVVGIDPATYAAAVASGGPKQFVVAITVRSDDPLVTGESGSVTSIPGTISVAGKDVIGPSPNFARSLLGSVGQATAETIAKSKGTIKAGDVVGLSGLEQRYDAQLRGTDGVSLLAQTTDAKGQTSSRELYAVAAVAGKPLTLTMDASAQTIAEAVLSGVTTTAASLVAIRPSTGQILAVANGPGSKGQPIGTYGQAAPGSTFKIVSGLALLRAGLTPDSVVSCTPTVTVDGKSFKNYDDYPADKLGQIPLITAFANSCNTAFISNNGKVTQAQLASAAAALGIGVDLDLGFPAYLGSIPETAGQTDHAATMIGQSKVLVAPMDMATVVASVMHGSVVRPSLVVGNPAVAAFPKPAAPLKAGEVAALRSMMGAVVTQGSGRVLADVGVTLAKTGTAEYGSATPPQTHAWMVAGKGDLAVAVYVETGESGSKSAAPLLKDFLTAYGG